MIYYTGDIHGSAKGIVAFAQHYELTESDIIVILGDVGANYYGNRRDRYCKDALARIGIDCGCMLPEKGDPWSGALGRLSCLRLDDMQVFYSEEPQYDNLKESEEQHYG